VLSIVLLWNLLVIAFVGICMAALLIGYRWRRTYLTATGGWLLYLPLAGALSAYLPALLCYLGSGLFVIVVSEGLVFEYEVSEVLEAPAGVDSEAALLASDVRCAHNRKLLAYCSLAAALMAASYAASGVTYYSSYLMAAAMLLVLVIAMYATR
jgi:hypothetical protein